MANEFSLKQICLILGQNKMNIKLALGIIEIKLPSLIFLAL